MSTLWGLEQTTVLGEALASLYPVAAKSRDNTSSSSLENIKTAAQFAFEHNFEFNYGLGAQ